jgi:hypothetical protein
MILDVSENATLDNDSFDSWLGYTFDDDAVVGSGSSRFNGWISEPTCVGLDSDRFGEVRRIFSRIVHMLGLREEPFMKEALDSRAMSRESSVVAGGREWTRCWISFAKAALEPSTCSDPDMRLWRFKHSHAFIHLSSGQSASKRRRSNRSPKSLVHST